MTEQKNLLRRVMDALVEGRSRQARRFVDEYMRTRPHLREGRD